MILSRRPGLSRRDFLRISLGAGAAPLLLGCDESASASDGNPRLTARPGSPGESPTPGLSPLGLDNGRDGFLYIPQSYSPETPAPLLVVLHGAGGESGNWASYQARAEALGFILLAPDSRSSTWDLFQGGFGPDVAFLDRALQHTFARCRIDPARVALGGFSDGASYALSLGIANGDLFTHLVGFSPGVARRSEFVGKPRVFVSHGTADRVLPVTLSRDEIIPALRQLGYDVTYREFEGGHEVPPAISEAALDWFLDVT